MQCIGLLATVYAVAAAFITKHKIVAMVEMNNKNIHKNGINNIIIINKKSYII